MHTITSRPPTPEEQQLIEAHSKFDGCSLGCGIFLFTLVPSVLLSALIIWPGGYFIDDAPKVAMVIGSLLAAFLFLVFLPSFISHQRYQRRLALEDHEAQLIQDIHVTDHRVVEIGLINDNEPILAFEIDENVALFLQGQWLRDEATYGAEPLSEEQYEDDALVEHVNHLPAPHSFPSSEFTVSRFPNSGIVTRIRVQGEYVAPERVVEALEPEFCFKDSELLEGSLDDIAEVLWLENRRRNKDEK